MLLSVEEWLDFYIFSFVEPKCNSFNPIPYINISLMMVGY